MHQPLDVSPAPARDGQVSVTAGRWGWMRLEATRGEYVVVVLVVLACAVAAITRDPPRSAAPAPMGPAVVAGDPDYFEKRATGPGPPTGADWVTSGAVIPVGQVTSTAVLTRDLVDRGFRFSPDARGADRRAFERSVAQAGPDASSLIEKVDGLTRVSFVALPGALGDMRGVGRGRYAVRLRPQIVRDPRRAPIVALHELGHVVDTALVTEDVRDRILDGVPCPYRPRSGRCTPDQRFADLFAVWALETGRPSTRSPAVQRFLDRFGRGLKRYTT